MCKSCPQKTMWDRPGGLDWNSQPPELKALGKVHAERVWKRQMTNVMQDVIAKMKWEEEHLSPEENDRLNANRRAIVENAINRNEDVIKAKGKRGRL